jgi:hypothetical protein
VVAAVGLTTGAAGPTAAASGAAAMAAAGRAGSEVAAGRVASVEAAGRVASVGVAGMCPVVAAGVVPHLPLSDHHPRCVLAEVHMGPTCGPSPKLCPAAAQVRALAVV